MTALANMGLEDVLEHIAARYGTPALRHHRYERAASPHLRTRAPDWSCEVSLAGYHHSGGGQSRMGGQGATPGAAAFDCMAEIEKFLASPRAREDRERYERHHAVRVGLHERRVTADCVSGRPHDHPGALAPELSA